MKKYVAEFIGTCVLVTLGCGTAMLVGCDSVSGCGYLLTALAFGLVIVGMAYCVGNISGCHINPAVSLAVLISKGISAGFSQNSYRGLVKVVSGADNVRNYSQCDSLLLGDRCGAHTFPDMQIANPTAIVEHEATTSKISEEQLFYCRQRGIGVEDAVGLIVNGYAKEVMDKLPMEFAVEAQKLLQVSLEGTIG